MARHAEPVPPRNSLASLALRGEDNSTARRPAICFVAAHARNTARQLLLRVLDLSSLELVHGSYVDPELGGRHNDLVFRALLDGAETLLYLILEHQRTAQPLMSVRMHEYSGRIWSRWRKDHPNARRVPPILSFVVYNGAAPWTEPVRLLDAVEAAPEVRRSIAPYHPQLEFILFDLTAVPDVELRLGATLTSLALLLLKHIDRPDLPRLLHGWFGLLRDVWRAPGGLQALQMVISYLTAASEAVSRDCLAAVVSADTSLASDTESCLMTYEQQVLERGREEGRLVGARRTLLRLIEFRFGSVPPALEQHIEGADEPQLDRLSERFLHAANWRELLD